MESLLYLHPGTGSQAGCGDVAIHQHTLQARQKSRGNRTKLIEVDNATKRWSEIMGDDVPEAMLRTAYVGILDPMTRTHLTNFQGKNTKPEALKQ